MTETDKIVNVVLKRYEADYPFATLKTEIQLTAKEKVWTAVIVALGLGMFGLMGIGAVTVWRWL